MKIAQESYVVAISSASVTGIYLCCASGRRRFLDRFNHSRKKPTTK